MGAAPAAAARADAVGARHGPRVPGGGRAAGHPRAGGPRGHHAQRRLGAGCAVPDGRVRAGPCGAPCRRTRGARRQGHHQRLRRRIDQGARRSARRRPRGGRARRLRQAHRLPRTPGAPVGRAVGTRPARGRSRATPTSSGCIRLCAEAIPPQSRSSIVHGDYRIDNTMLDAKTPPRCWPCSTGRCPRWAIRSATPR